MKRVEYIDTAKGCLILLVVIGHVLIIMNPEYNKLYYTAPQAFIYAFHMPSFFIIHGTNRYLITVILLFVKAFIVGGISLFTVFSIYRRTEGVQMLRQRFCSLIKNFVKI